MGTIYALNVETRDDHGYKITKVRILGGQLSDVRAEIAYGLWGGWSSRDSGDAYARRFREHLRNGYTQYFDHTWASPHLIVEYQHFDKETHDGIPFCDPRINLGTAVDAINANLIEYKRLMRARRGHGVRFPRTPEELIARYPKAVHVDRVEGVDGWVWDYLVRPDQALPRALMVAA